jgi:hypothetical protein
VCQASDNKRTIERYVGQLNLRNFAVLDELIGDSVSIGSLFREDYDTAPEAPWYLIIHVVGSPQPDYQTPRS